jgi:uncharacterized membrane protein YkoI
MSYNPSLLGILAPILILNACNRPSARESAASTPTSSPQTAAPSLSDSAKVDSATARRTALAKVPHGKVVSEELEQENGRLVYSFDIKGSAPGVEEVQVDARDGSVVSMEHESPAQQAKEAQQDQKQQ